MPPLDDTVLEQLPPAARERITEEDISQCRRIQVHCSRSNYEKGNFQKYRLRGPGEDELWLVDTRNAVRLGNKFAENYARLNK